MRPEPFSLQSTLFVTIHFLDEPFGPWVCCGTKMLLQGPMHVRGKKEVPHWKVT